MSELIKHECGVALIRLKKPLSYFKKTYGTHFFGLNKMHILMQKMHNRGQDGAGIAAIKLNTKVGTKYIHRRRSDDNKAIESIYKHIDRKFQELNEKYDNFSNDSKRIKKKMPFAGELLMGHLRYGTHGKSGIEFCHPVKRSSNWKARNLLMAGNFNLTNVPELIRVLKEIGQHPMQQSDTVTILEKFGHYLDTEVSKLYKKYKSKSVFGEKLTDKVEANIDFLKIIKKATKDFDGGYVMAGATGSGQSFVIRDPSGIRPAWYYANEDFIVIASERVAIQTAFNLKSSEVVELPPANAIIINKNGNHSLYEYTKPLEKKSCSFERIYFSRGNDRDIYKERLALGSSLTERVLTAIDRKVSKTVFTFIPNTAEVSFYGLLKGVDGVLNAYKKQEIREGNGSLSEEQIEKILSLQTRADKILIKDQKMRTFITNDNDRDDLVSHVYDITYGTIERNVDTLVAIDDSIVRGTTLKKSILSILGRLEPKKIVVVSSAPQIRYPDCYGIDMAKLADFIAFKAMKELLMETGQWQLWHDTYIACKNELLKPAKEMKNCVKTLYDTFTEEEISNKIAELITPKGFKPKLEVIYQSVEGLHNACPNHKGDWYFTGNYPTAGGNRVVNQSFVFAYENKNQRAY